MRITKIELENFGSYGKGSIDLNPIHSATVSGKNGSGKSTAFVDAPLWALFGKCRSDTDNMMRHSSLRMSVLIEFELDGHLYRVERTRSKTTKIGKTELSFMMHSPEDEWIPIGAHKLTETQEAIKQVLNADYELCTTTNFMVQGHADRFSTASPSERKAILYQVLRLDEYAKLKQDCNRLNTIAQGKVEFLTDGLIPLEEEANSILYVKGKVTESEELLQIRSETQLGVAQKIKTKSELKGKKLADLGALKQHKEEHKALVENRNGNELQMVEVMETIEQNNSIVSRKEEIEEGIAKHTVAQDAMKLLIADHEANTQKIIGYDAVLNELTEKEGKQLATRERVVAAMDKMRHTKELAEQRKSMDLTEIQQQLTRDHEQGDLLKKVPCWDELQRKCQFTIKAVQTIEGLPNLTKKHEAILEKDYLKPELPNYEADMDTRQKQLLDLSNSELRIEIDARSKVKWDLQDVNLNLQKDIQEQEITMKSYSQMLILQPHLLQAQTSLKHLEEQRKTLGDSIHIINNQIMKKALLIEKEESLVNELTTLERELDLLATQEQQNQDAITTHTKLLGSYRHQLEMAQAAQVQVTKLKEELTRYQLRSQATKQLTGYYTTIPVLIMEQAVPTLEATTNQILDKISPSGMRIRLETQKALKSSDRLAETLDILVRDVYGERPYENYSGGERFRLDMALRFGLSQLLMQRAGSRMESLIIDEGLGSLDADGLALLRECLGKLEQTFGLILVISHVEEIQGTFETEIVCENRQGSSIKVL